MRFFSHVTFLSSEFVGKELMTSVGIVFVTFVDILSGASIISLHMITEVSAVLL